MQTWQSMDFDKCFFIYSDQDNEDRKKKKHKKDTTPSGNRYVH